MTPRLRVLASAGVVVFLVLFGLGSADAQRAVPRSAAPQGHHAVPRPLPARPLPGSQHYYRGPNVYRPYYASPYYWYGGFYGGYYSYPFYFSVGQGPYAPYYYGYPYPWYPYDPAASLRLQVTPRETEVFVDGSYAGTVDDFDGTFQRLRLYPGEHTVELFLPGHRSLTQRLYLQSGKTFTMRAQMEELTRGEPEPVRPSGVETSQASRARPPVSSPESDEEDWPVGTLALRVQPGGAKVTIDGELWEPSAAAGPLIVQLATGVHTIEIRKEGYRPYITELAVRQGETTTINVAMSPDN